MRRQFALMHDQDVSISRTENDVMLPLTISQRHLYLLVGFDKGVVAHNINPDMCFLTKAKRPKI